MINDEFDFDLEMVDMSMDNDNCKQVNVEHRKNNDIAQIEDNDNEVNVEEIMEKIRDRVRQQRSAINTQDIDALLNDISQNSNVSNESYYISSHHRFIGPILVKGRTLVNGETRRYIDPSINKQMSFNQSTAKLLGNVNERINNIISRLDAIEKKLKENEVPSWSKFYNIEVNEKFLNDNVEFHKEFITLIEEYAKKSSIGKIPKLIEVGLGTATFSIYFSRGPYNCTGIDNEPSIIKKSIITNKKLGGYAKFILIDALDLDLFKDGYFDVAFSQGTLEHFDNETLFKLLSRQLAVAHYVIFSVPSKFWLDREFGNERKIGVEEWKLLLNSAGFNVLYIDYYHEKTQIACVIGPGQ